MEENIIQNKYRVDSILDNNRFKLYQKKNDEHETDREFCKHDIQHSLDVARIAHIINLEDNLGLKKDIIYATALLHDIGRWKQYEDGTLHAQAGAELSKEILLESNFSKEEIVTIGNAIFNHSKLCENGDLLSKIIYTADKKSRNCFSCKAAQACNWPSEKRNQTILY